MFKFSIDTGPTTGRPDWRILLFMCLFGLGMTAGGYQWLSSGKIEIRAGQSSRRQTASQPPGDVEGRIDSADWLYYPLCVSWVGLAAAIVVLPIIAFFTQQHFYARLATFCCVALLLLACVTVGAALWSGP